MSIILNMGMMTRLRRWLSGPSAQTFSNPENTRFYSMAMALESGLLEDGTSTRQAALGVPALLKGRNMICNISTIPLQLLDPSRKPVREALFEQIDPQTANVVTLAMTLEDLLCDGISWWEKLTYTPMGFPRSARHVDSRRVTVNPPEGYANPLPSGFDPASTIYVDGKPRSAFDFIRFDSPNPALMVVIKRAIARAVALEDAAAMYADNPRPGDYFTPAEGVSDLDDTKVRSILGAWIQARKKRSTAFVPETLEYNTVQAPNPQELQLVGLMERAALDIANGVGIDPEDLGISTTSRTYQNATDRRQDRVNDVLSSYMRAITDRLSMADVTRNGYRAYFDLDDYMRADPATRWATHKTAVELGATDVAEVRERESWPARPDLEKPPEPKQIEAPTDVSRETSRELVPVANSRGGKMQTFTGDTKQVTLRLDADSTTFAVDAERRIIEGRILLFDRPADNGEGVFTFAPGSVQWNKGAVNRVKFLRDHDWGISVGAALAIHDRGDALDGRYKVARGPLGDQALTDAEDGAADGLSVGLDITEYEETAPGEYYVTRATLNETSLTPRPAFDDARLTSVTASKKGNAMGDKPEDETPDAPAIDYDALAAAFAKIDAEAFAKLKPAAPAAAEKPSDEKPGEVNAAARPTPVELAKKTATTAVKEKSPYTFDRAGRFAAGGEHDFSTDLIAVQRAGDLRLNATPEGKRVAEQFRAKFAVANADVNELNPTIQRPDMYVDQPGFRRPLWEMINKGGLPNGVQPFGFPKFATATGLSGDHTEGVEPTSGTFTTTGQTVTPTAISGKASVTREVWEQGGNPAVSNLIWAKMVRSYDEGLETASATFLATLTAATDIVLTTAGDGATVGAELEAALAGLQFTRGYDFSDFAMEQILYKKIASAVDGMDRPLYPIIGAQNANGTAEARFRRLNVAGLVGVPSWALASVAAAVNSSWLFDPSVVHGWADAPQRLEFAGTDAAGDYAPVAMIDIAIWGHKAFAVTDIAGVRQVTYDETA